MLEHPSLGILLKCKIEKLSAHNGFPENIQARGRFVVSIAAKLLQQIILLTEYFPDQVNIIQVYHGKWNKGLLLNRNENAGKLTIGND